MREAGWAPLFRLHVQACLLRSGAPRDSPSEGQSIWDLTSTTLGAVHYFIFLHFIASYLECADGIREAGGGRTGLPEGIQASRAAAEAILFRRLQPSIDARIMTHAWCSPVHTQIHFRFEKLLHILSDASDRSPDLHRNKHSQRCFLQQQTRALLAHNFSKKTSDIPGSEPLLASKTYLPQIPSCTRNIDIPSTEWTTCELLPAAREGGGGGGCHHLREREQAREWRL